MRRPVIVALSLSAAILLAAIADTVLAHRAGQQSPLFYGWEIGSPLIWGTVGALAGVLWPDRRIGRMMQLLGLVLLVDAPAAFALATTESWVAVALVVARAVQPFQVVLFGHLLLAYPHGRFHRAGERWYFVGVYAYATVVATTDTITTTRAILRVPWTGSVPSAGLAGGGSSSLVSAGWLVLAVLFLALLVRKIVLASHRERRTLAYPLACGLAIIVLFAVGALLTAAGVLGTSNPVSDALPYLAVLTAPGAFLIGLVRERVDYGLVADFVRTLEGAPIGQLEPALRKLLRDPTLRIAFPQDGRYVGEHGEHVLVPSDATRAVLPIGDPPIAVVVHDLSLADEPHLLGAASAATRLALDNARLYALVAEQLAEVRASRRRIVDAAAEERRRLERNLHDGAQQRMLAVALAVGLLERHLAPDDDAARTALDRAQEELRTATAELRELARGIHPAVLTEEGLSAAVAALARRLPFPVDVDDALPHRVPPPVEAAAYYMASEALSNVVKHSHATTVHVSLTLTGPVLTLEVTDDGIGGATVDDHGGLRGLIDRAAAFDGRLTVAAHHPHGTRLTIDLHYE